MSKKININQVMDDCVSIQNQIDGLSLLLQNKKKILSKYFDYSGERQISNDDCIVYVSEKANVDYDIDKLYEKLDKDILNKFIDKSYKIRSMSSFVKYCNAKGISNENLKPYIYIEKVINKKKLSDLYDKKEITLKDLEGCYNANVSKSIVLRLKNASKEFNIK